MKFEIIDFKTNEIIESGSFKKEMFYDLFIYIISRYKQRKVIIDFNKPTIVISLKFKEGDILWKYHFMKTMIF